MLQPAAEPSRHRLTVVDYYRMGEVGILAPDARVELIDGELIYMAPPGSLHAGKMNRLVKSQAQAVEDDAVLLVQNPVVLGEHSARQPTSRWPRPQSDFYENRHPGAGDLLVVVEVANFSRRWLIDLRAKRLERYRDAQLGAYTLADRPDLGAAIELAALPVARVDLSSLFP